MLQLATLRIQLVHLVFLLGDEIKSIYHLFKTGSNMESCKVYPYQTPSLFVFWAILSQSFSWHNHWTLIMSSEKLLGARIFFRWCLLHSRCPNTSSLASLSLLGDFFFFCRRCIQQNTILNVPVRGFTLSLMVLTCLMDTACLCTDHIYSSRILLSSWTSNLIRCSLF